MKPTGIGFAKFLLVGGVVGLLTLTAQLGIEAWLRPFKYAYFASTLMAYAIGIVLAFLLHGVITFALPRDTKRKRQKIVSSGAQFVRFATGAVCSGVATSLLAAISLNYLDLYRWFGSWAGSLVFGMSAVVVGSVGYLFNLKFVFAERRPR